MFPWKLTLRLSHSFKNWVIDIYLLLWPLWEANIIQMLTDFCLCPCVFSFKCRQMYHAPTDCATIRKWLTKCADDSETANYISAHTKDVRETWEQRTWLLATFTLLLRSGAVFWGCGVKTRISPLQLSLGSSVCDGCAGQERQKERRHHCLDRGHAANVNCQISEPLEVVQEKSVFVSLVLLRAQMQPPFPCGVNVASCCSVLKHFQRT